jgi:pimeloyl-ACP methyl ester carboxylesterase
MRFPDTYSRAFRDMLEVIDKGCMSQSHSVPLLFVHGAWHAAWCWDEHFLAFFADKGYRALAVSLRGHGSSPTPRPLRACSIADYVDDVGFVADSLPIRPVVIGHSMGGLIVQKYLESHEAPAAVLMASMPPQGYLGSNLRLLKRNPWHFARIALTGKSLACVNTPRLARDRFFSARTPDADVRKYAQRLTEESSRAGVDGLLRLPRPRRVTTTLLVLGADDDGAVTRKEVRATARAYRTEADFFSDMGHDMMLEPGWAAVAERIHTWLAAQGL